MESTAIMRKEAIQMSDIQKAFLFDAAERYIWWETPNEAMVFPKRVLARVMIVGV